FSFLWTGTFTATKAGTYTFGAGQSTGGVDDEEAVFIDLNDNGIFENATERVVHTGGGCCGSYTGQIMPTFTAGESHKVALAFQEFGGGERGSLMFMVEGDPTFGTFTPINPGSPAQAGMWTVTTSPANNVTKSGAGTVTFGASNTY